MLVFLITRFYLRGVSRSEAEADERNPKVSHWQNEVLASLLVLGTVIPALLAGDHALFLPFTFVCWALAFVAWGVLGLASWLLGRLRGASAEANQPVAK
jgi:hypothetical protein